MEHVGVHIKGLKFPLKLHSLLCQEPFQAQPKVLLSSHRLDRLPLMKVGWMIISA